MSTISFNWSFFDQFRDLDCNWEERFGNIHLADHFLFFKDADFMKATSVSVLKGLLLAFQEKHASLVGATIMHPFLIQNNKSILGTIKTSKSFEHIDGTQITDPTEVEKKTKITEDQIKQLVRKADDNMYLMKQYETAIAFVKVAIRKKQNFFQNLFSGLLFA